jgi:hypothetical protein
MILQNNNFKRDVHLDAILVHAAINNLFEPCAIGLGMTADEAFGRAKWLKKQSKSYILSVSEEVVRIENEAKEII